MPEIAQAGLKRELGLRDLVLTQILFVVGLTNFGYAAKLGASHVVFRLAAIFPFYIPLAMVVIHMRWYRCLKLDSLLSLISFTPSALRLPGSLKAS